MAESAPTGARRPLPRPPVKGAPPTPSPSLDLPSSPSPSSSSPSSPPPLSSIPHTSPRPSDPPPPMVDGPEEHVLPAAFPALPPTPPPSFALSSSPPSSSPPPALAPLPPPSDSDASSASPADPSSSSPSSRSLSLASPPPSSSPPPPLPPRAYSLDQTPLHSVSSPTLSPTSPASTPPPRPRTLLPTSLSSSSLQVPNSPSSPSSRSSSISVPSSPQLSSSASSPNLLATSSNASSPAPRRVLGRVYPTEAEFEAAHPMALPPLVADSQMRDKVAYEVLTSETSYVRNLYVLLDLWAPVLREHPTLDKLLGLLAQVPPLVRVNAALWDALRVRLSSWSPSSTLGDVFLTLTPFLKMYKAYTAGYEGAQTDLQTALAQEGSRFVQQHAELQAYPLSKSLSLASFLIQPIQRLPRYVLLLQDLFKHTPEGHADRELLQEALKAVKGVASEIEAEMAAQENRLKCLAIQARFGSSVSVVAAHRRFVLEGVLTKQCRKERKPRRFFLFSDLLIYAQEPVGGLTLLLSGTLPLHQVRVQELPPGGDALGFNILAPGKSFAVYGATPQERTQWMTAILQSSDAERARLREKGELPPELPEEEQVASVWAADDTTNSCTLCKETFTLLRRRHHCRKCGRVVCGRCSEGRMLVPAVDPRDPVRVCKECFGQAQARGRTASSAVLSPPMSPKS